MEVRHSRPLRQGWEREEPGPALALPPLFPRVESLLCLCDLGAQTPDWPTWLDTDDRPYGKNGGVLEIRSNPRVSQPWHY